MPTEPHWLDSDEERAVYCARCRGSRVVNGFAGSWQEGGFWTEESPCPECSEEES